ncbi:hypothetical protein BGW80DRAFT_915731 [Lactifluus volemus]|nr:hypothetical protein BGW80DRAFT_915731 [Lactifluus volemus]
MDPFNSWFFLPHLFPTTWTMLPPRLHTSRLRIYQITTIHSQYGTLYILKLYTNSLKLRLSRLCRSSSPLLSFLVATVESPRNGFSDYRPSTPPNIRLFDLPPTISILHIKIYPRYQTGDTNDRSMLPASDNFAKPLPPCRNSKGALAEMQNRLDGGAAARPRFSGFFYPFTIGSEGIHYLA